MTVDWRRQKAVVFESDDWGLCAWSPDEAAHRALADTPVFQSPVGRLYGRSTLESAEDVRRLCAVLAGVRGGDGFPPVWQANTVMAAPDYSRLRPPAFDCDELPVVLHPGAPSRWRRPGLWDEVRAAAERGLWWPELHGLLHIPAGTWLGALRSGEPDASCAFEHESLVCGATQGGSEYGPGEPWALRRRQLASAARHFNAFFGREARSFCPPDYGFERAVEAEAAGHGLLILQGWTEQAGLPRALHAWRRWRWPRGGGALFATPPRIAFEPRGEADGELRFGWRPALRGVRAAWARNRPAVVSTHRHNYAHLDPGWSEAGRSQLRALLAALAAEGATFLTDAEVFALWSGAWSLRPIGRRRAVLRYRGAPRRPLRVPLPAGAGAVRVRLAREGGEEQPAEREPGVVRLEVPEGDYVVEWEAA